MNERPTTPTPSSGDELRKLIEAVAALDTFAQGDMDDSFCPFDCGWAEYSNEQHDDDCPISIARRLRDA